MNGVELPRRTAAMSLHSPVSYGSGYLGAIGAGATFQHRTRLSGKKFDPDLNPSLDVGLGNPEKIIGVNARLNIYGISNVQGAGNNLGEGTLDLHLSRKINERLWLGAGGYDLIGWKLEEPNRLQSLYFSATKLFGAAPFFASLTAGVGNGRFRKDEDYTLEKEAPFAFFASAALRILPEGNLIVEWTGYNVFSGISWLPFRKIPVQVVLGADEIFHKRWKVVIGVSAGFFLQKKYRGPGNGFYRISLPVPPPPQTSRV